MLLPIRILSESGLKRLFRTEQMTARYTTTWHLSIVYVTVTSVAVGPLLLSQNKATRRRSIRSGMGNHNSALLEAASVGDLRKAKQLLDKAGAADVNWMGQV